MCRQSLVAFAFLLVPSAAFAQIGTGWVQYEPPSVIHLDGANGIEVSPGGSTSVMNAGASFTNQGGIETFALHDPISNRAERRIQNTYLTGRRQFEGEVRVSPPTDDESVMQIFGGNSGATTQMIRAYDVGGGTLRKVPGSVVLVENIHGVWIKVNVIHDVGGNFVKTYINGKLISTGDGEATNAGTDGWYHKYGCYGTLRTGSAKVEWRNVKHFRDGTSPPSSDAGAPPADSGSIAPDAGSDPVTPDAAGTGGAPGTGGTPATGGAPGTGGAPATGGAPGTGGARGPSGTGGSSGAAGQGGDVEEPDPVPPKKSAASGGCQVGGDAGGMLAFLLVALLIARRRQGSRP